MAARIPYGWSIRQVLEWQGRREIDTNTNCWLWLGQKSHVGYGILITRFGIPGDREGELVARFVHRLAYNEFVKSPLGMSVNHTCRNKHCFNPGHLYLGTAKDNALDAINDGTSLVGYKSPNAKFTYESSLEVRERAKALGTEFSVVDFAKEFEVAPSTMSMLVRGIRYRNVPGPRTHKLLSGMHLRGEQIGTAKFSNAEVVALREEFASKYAAEITYRFSYFVKDVLSRRSCQGAILRSLLLGRSYVTAGGPLATEEQLLRLPNRLRDAALLAIQENMERRAVMKKFDITQWYYYELRKAITS